MSPVWVLLLLHFWVVNPSRCFLCLYIPHSFISFDCCLLLSICVFISLCVASVALALVFMPGLYPTAYRATFPAFFMRLPLVCFYCLCVLFVFPTLPRRCPLLTAFLSVLFCLLSLLTSDSRFDLVWFRLSCDHDHGWIRSGSVNVRKTTTTDNLSTIFYLIKNYIVFGWFWLWYLLQ